MRFKELLRFRRENGGDVPIEILRELQLPMPDDALEQFVADHGTNEDFQVQYGDLDLHAIRWNRLKRSAAEICECSIYEHLNATECVIVMVREDPPSHGVAICQPLPGCSRGAGIRKKRLDALAAATCHPPGARQMGPIRRCIGVTKISLCSSRERRIPSATAPDSGELSSHRILICFRRVAAT